MSSAIAPDEAVSLDLIPQYILTEVLESRLGVSGETLANWAKTVPGFPQPLRVRRRYLWPLKEVAAYIESKQREGAAHAS